MLFLLAKNIYFDSTEDLRDIGTASVLTDIKVQAPR
jgi:hypothetical protein